MALYGEWTQKSRPTTTSSYRPTPSSLSTRVTVSVLKNFVLFPRCAELARAHDEKKSHRFGRASKETESTELLGTTCLSRNDGEEQAPRDLRESREKGVPT